MQLNTEFQYVLRWNDAWVLLQVRFEVQKIVKGGSKQRLLVLNVDVRVLIQVLLLLLLLLLLLMLLLLFMLPLMKIVAGVD